MGIAFRSRRSARARHPGVVGRNSDRLRALYERVGPDAYALARALSPDTASAEHAVVQAFAAISDVGVDDGLDRRSVLARVISALPSDSSTHGAETLTFALAVCARCKVDEIAQISGDDRRQVAVHLTNALRRARRSVST